MICYWICGHIYVTNGQTNKQTLYIYHVFRIIRSFPKSGAESCSKRDLEYESILCNSTEVSFDWTYIRIIVPCRTSREF